jgi:hypothetical protein
MFALLVFAFGVSGCQNLGGRRITVQIRDADGLRGGEAVYMAGVRIGTTDEPLLVNGTAHVPVTIYRAYKEALPSGSIFLISPDPNANARLALIGTGCSQSQQGRANRDVYDGASTRIEFIAMCGMGEAKELLKNLTK